YPNPDRHPTPAELPKNYYVAVYGVLNVPAPTLVVNQDRDDVTVVRASSTTPLTMQTSDCVPLDAGSLDCTDALSRAAGAPALHRVVLTAHPDLSGSALLRVTTASKNGRHAPASGSGCRSAQAADGNQRPEDSG